MRISIPVISAHKVPSENARVISREKAWRWLALSAIVLLAAILRFANLRALGLANHYYAAAVASMLKSWHNFFFVAAEPGASVSVDKPPVGLWIQTISAYFLGVNGLALLLPQILAGILSILVLYHLVRRAFGTTAGLLAALALAITPVVIATDRNNTIDSTLILTLLLAAWAFIKATESGKWRYLLLGVTLVGLGFNIKMLEAYLPLPAFYLLYLLGAKGNLWRKVGRLALASLLLLVISLSWAVIVDLTPANQRPYVGSSGDNSEMSLIIGYNGIERLMGMFGRRGAGQMGNRIPQGYVPNPGVPGQPPGQNGLFRGPNSPGTFPPGTADGNDGQQALPQGRLNRYDGGFQSPDRSPNTPRQNFAGGIGGGFSGTGRAGALRLFIPPLSKEVSWLLPFGLASALLLLAGTARTPGADPMGRLAVGGRNLLQRGRLLPRILSFYPGSSPGSPGGHWCHTDMAITGKAPLAGGHAAGAGDHRDTGFPGVYCPGIRRPDPLVAPYGGVVRLWLRFDPGNPGEAK
jgi:4-amino-4-deoxy-L-arabinose transferase-like glycosyltransferase